jgi:hypothetical protein
MVRAITIQNVILLVLFFTVTFLLLEAFPDDPGVGWHLANGKYIFEKHIIPEYDPFLFSYLPRTWVSDQWLSDVILYSIYKEGSWLFLATFFTLLYLATFFSAYLVFYSYTKRYILSSLAALLAFKAAEIHFILRPVVFSFPLFLGVVWFAFCYIKRLEKKSESGIEKLDFIYLGVLFLLWANLHPSFVLGLLVLAFILISDIVNCFLNKEFFSPRWLKFLALILLVIGITFVNPYGIQLHFSIFSLGNSSYFMQLHDEWQPLSLSGVEGEIFFILFLGNLVWLLMTLTQRIKCQPFFTFSMLLSLTFAFLTLSKVRFLPYFGIAAGIPFIYGILALSELKFKNLLVFGKLTTFFSLLEKREGYFGVKATLLLFTGIVGVILYTTLYLGYMPLYQGDLAPDKNRYPYHLIDKLKLLAKDNAPHPTIVAATPEMGGFITWFGNSQLKPIIDDRNTLIGENFYRDYIETLSDKDQPQKMLNYLLTLNADYALFNKDGALAKYLKDKVIAEEGDFALIKLPN